MATMNVSLPDEMKDWVEQQAANGRYGNVSDYIRDVLRRERAMAERFDTMVDDALASGTVAMSPAELFDDIKRRSRDKILAAADAIRAERNPADDAA